VLILLILAMMVLPLPPFALDLFFTFNIAISVIVMLVAMSVMKPLDFSVFPTVLLVTTCCACRSTSLRRGSFCSKAIPGPVPPGR
jgi:flagellar biosynthesis component FlhA